MKAWLGKAHGEVADSFICVSTFEEAVKHMNMTVNCVMMVPYHSAHYIVPRIHHSPNLAKVLAYGKATKFELHEYYKAEHVDGDIEDVLGKALDDMVTLQSG